MSALQTEKEIADVRAGNRLDAYVAKAVFGEDIYRDSIHGLWRLGTERRTDKGCPPPYSTEIGAAWKVIEKLDGDPFTFAVGVGWCDLYRDRDQVDGITADSTPLAICKAAMLAILKRTARA